MASNPPDWKITTLGEFAPFTYGEGLPKRLRDSTGNIPVYGSNGIVGRHNNPLVNSAGVIIGRKGTVGAVHFSSKPFWPIDTTFYVPATSQRDIRYTYYLLRTLGLESMNSDSAVPGLNRDAAHARIIGVAPLSEQHAIAHILGILDDKIELNRRMNQTLEAMAQALFKSWFVDFEPFRDQGMQDSPLGEIPVGWRVVSIEDIAERVGMGPFGSSIKVSTFVPDGIPIISGQHLNQTLLEDNHYNFITPSHAEKLKNSNVFRGDIVFTHAGNIGQVAYIPETSQYERYVISQRQFYMRCDLSKISPLFVIYFFKTPQGQHSLLANTSSTGVPSISQPVSYLKTIKLPVPTKTLIDAFDKIVRKLHQQIANNISQAKTLSAIRDALLPRLLSGEIRVKDAEKFVESKL